MKQVKAAIGEKESKTGRAGWFTTNPWHSCRRISQKDKTPLISLKPTLLAKLEKDELSVKDLEVLENPLETLGTENH